MDRSGAAGLSAALKLARIALMAVAGGLAAAGCTTSGTPALDLPSLNMAALGVAGSGTAVPRTVAFEMIEGAPDELWHNKLKKRLTEEANARNVAAVSRQEPSQYVIRGYVGAHVRGQKTTITWVWDVFTAADHERVARLSGEVPGALSERGWAAADDAVVARMAQDGMSRLAAFLATSAPPNVASASGAEPLAFLASRP